MAGIARVGERQRFPKVVLRLRQRVERQRSVARFAQCGSRATGDRAHVLAGCPRQLDCIDVVMRDHLGVVFRPSERLDPLRRSQMLLRTLRAGNLPVRDVTDEQMFERVLGLTLDGAAARTLDELLLLQRM